MSATENLKNTFSELVEAYDDTDDDAKESLTKKIKDYLHRNYVNI